MAQWPRPVPWGGGEVKSLLYQILQLVLGFEVKLASMFSRDSFSSSNKYFGMDVKRRTSLKQ